ncbi:unnamed protein product [Prunus armeniaca]|uniref:Uncharacterized protein n=1 Tax=Prunus armeniaca TaxID=36596 RepID=A0A6J5Y1E8_PRUAR|nr:unnamed protein product [Prunus armeniaca]
MVLAPVDLNSTDAEWMTFVSNHGGAPLLQLSATTSVYDGESNCPEHEKQEQVADGRVDDLLPNVERPQLVRQGQVQEAVDELHTPEGCQNGASCLDCQAEEGQKLSSVRIILMIAGKVNCQTTFGKESHIISLRAYVARK